MAFVTSFYNWVWQESVWVPPGYTWDDFTPGKSSWNVPNSGDLWTYPFLLAGFFIFLNYYVFTPFIFIPFWKRFAPRDSADANEDMDELFLKHDGKPSKKDIATLAKSIDWDQRRLERFLRRNSKYWKNFGKFLECSWGLLYYSSFCVLGMVVLYDKPWAYDVRKCWTGFPKHDLEPELWWYYMIALAQYYSQITMDTFRPVRRKDFVQMQIHHVVTICLVCFSFITNMMRMGALILAVHECADIPLLTGKIAGYFGHQKVMNNCFIAFVVMWFVTRLGYFPSVLMRSTLFEAHVQEGLFYPVYYILNSLLIAIFLMHLIWTYIIVKSACMRIQSGKVTDARSSGSEESGDENKNELLEKEKKKM